MLLHNKETSSLAAELVKACPAAEVAECNSYEGLPEAIARFRPDIVYTVRFAGSNGFPRDALFGNDGPQWVANGGAGTDHFGLWDADIVTVTNAAGVAADMMAEYVVGAFLHFTLDVPGLISDQKHRIWRQRVVRPLKGSSLVIVGLGKTGQAIALRAKALGMNVAGTRARPRQMENIDEVCAPEELSRLLAQADFLAVCAPLTANSRGLLGDAEFACVKPGAILVDVSRGGVVDQRALVQALRSGQIAAAALDVFETEPLPANHEFWSRSDVLISPHCSSVYAGWEKASFSLFLDNLKRWIAGDPLLNTVSPELGY
ncbi:D-2-hydroxyacid dehydrogenase [uncultured Roseobacter sp.]|uniref:D-2-hydroxyacid dehydrogenase n=1 Tax=uncultured Roseobacter sp. TaxID=114847 RepID=UPI002613B58A|nr:D-2-hydroxyacid dehydrogenase [uncultured Roseobacter sp.]